MAAALLPPAPALDARGLPVADAAVERVARAVGLAASLFVLGCGAWELTGPLGAGHYAVIGARGMIAENMVKWGIGGPVRQYTLDAPSPGLYYGHHPWGMFWLIAGLFALFGRHEWVLRIAPLLMSAACPALLYAIGRALWGPVPGAVAAWGLAVLPITLGFAQFPGFEVPVVFGCLLATWGYVRLARTWQRRWLVVSLAGVGWALQSDWESFVFVGLILAVLLATSAFLPRRWFGAVDARRFLQWWSLAAGLAVGTVVMYVVIFQKVGQLDSLLNQGKYRTSGSGLPLATVLAARRHWIELMFTPPAIALGKLALPILLFRVLVLRRLLEVFPLALLGMAAFHYVVFKNGADVHIYWPLPFNAYFGLALGCLVHVGMAPVEWAAARLGRPSPRTLGLGLLGASLAVPAALLPDGLRGLRYARYTGGRLNDDGHLNLQDLDKAAAVAWLAPRFEHRTVIGLHPGMGENWALEWNLHRPTEVAARPPKDDPLRRHWLLDARFTADAELAAVAEAHAVTAIGPFWAVDTAQPAGPLVGYSFHEREPTAWEWYWKQGNDPIRTVVEDPYLTWEWRDALGQAPNPPPAGPPTTREHRRIAHNVALAGDARALAEQLREELLAGMDRLDVAFTDGTRLVAREVIPGVAPRLRLLFEARGPLPLDLQFEVRTRLDRDARWSWVPRDDKEKKVGTNFALPPKRWKAGHLYALECEIRHRPGTERFYGYWATRARIPSEPKPASGPPEVHLLVVE